MPAELLLCRVDVGPHTTAAAPLLDLSGELLHDLEQIGEGAGVCFEQGTNTKASCWGFAKDDNGVYTKKNQSYLIEMARMENGMRLSDHIDLGTTATAAFNGSWLCTSVIKMPQAEYNSVACLRFLPKQNIASLNDPRFAKGEMKVITYLEGRTGEPTPAEDEIAALKESAEQAI